MILNRALDRAGVPATVGCDMSPSAMPACGLQVRTCWLAGWRADTGSSFSGRWRPKRTRRGSFRRARYVAGYPSGGHRLAQPVKGQIAVYSGVERRRRWTEGPLCLAFGEEWRGIADELAAGLPA